MIAFGLTVFTLVWWWQGALGTSPLQAYSMSLKEAQGLSLCSYDFYPNVNDDRVPRIIETVICYTCGKDCNPHGKSTATCMQLTTSIHVTYTSSGLRRNETFPIGCSCVNRRPRKGVFEKVNIVQ